MMKYSEYLLGNIKEYKKRFFCKYWEKGEFARAMKFLYHCASPTEELISEARNFSTGWLRDYYEKHLKEESGEISFLEEDLERMDIYPGDPDEISMAMIGSQFYMIKYVSPVCLLGYMAVSEADPIDGKYVDVLEGLYGEQKFLRMHAVRDIEHGREMLDIFDKIPGMWQRYVDNSAENALMYYSKVYGR